jgi:hypothetical protein
MFVARQSERPLRFSPPRVIRGGGQPDRLAAVGPSTLAEERDLLAVGPIPTSFAHDLVDPPMEQGAALKCGRGPHTAHALILISRVGECWFGQDASSTLTRHLVSDRVLGVGFKLSVRGYGRT